MQSILDSVREQYTPLAARQGLAAMFNMMNEARIGVGLGAVMLGYTGYLHALDYARNRPQGRHPQAKDPAQRYQSAAALAEDVEPTREFIPAYRLSGKVMMFSKT